MLALSNLLKLGKRWKNNGTATYCKWDDLRDEVRPKFEQKDGYEIQMDQYHYLVHDEQQSHDKRDFVILRFTPEEWLSRSNRLKETKEVDTKKKELRLKVAEAYTRDVGRAVMRIDYNSMDSLGASNEDVIEIMGKRRTVAKCLSLYPSDDGKGLMRIDGLIRNNAGVDLGDTVAIKKVYSFSAAEKVVLTPLETLPTIDERYFNDALENMPLMKGDNVMVPYFGGRLTYQVVDLMPTDIPSVVSQKTIFQVAVMTLQGSSQTQSSYNDIGGLDEEIRRAREMIEIPMRHPEIIEKLDIHPTRGLLLHGPTGIGKSLLAKTIAYESNANIINVSGPDLMSKVHGDSDASLTGIFKDAKENAPSIIIFDQIDSICPKEGRVMSDKQRSIGSELLSLMDGLNTSKDVFVVATTTTLRAVDPALRRPGRFEIEIGLKIPDSKGRLKILHIHTRNMPLDTDVDLEKIAEMTQGFVGGRLQQLCQQAARKCFQRIGQNYNFEDESTSPELLMKLIVTMSDFENALKQEDMSKPFNDSEILHLQADKQLNSSLVPTSEDSDKIQCVKCNHFNSKESKFCNQCGSSLS